MMQVEHSKYGHDNKLENMHVNGGGYSIYWHCKNNTNCIDIMNNEVRNVQVGYGHMFDILYKRNVDEETNIFDNVDHLTLPYIGSAWKSSTGVHVSVTNELLSERTMACVVDGSDTIVKHTIPAHPKLEGGKIEMKIEDIPEFKDLPYDIDLIVSNEQDVLELNCYDITDTGDISTSPLVKNIKFYDDTDSSVSISVSTLFVLASIIMVLLL